MSLLDMQALSEHDSTLIERVDRLVRGRNQATP